LDLAVDRVDERGLVKVADFGLSRELIVQDYYRLCHSKTPVPVRWMAPESLSANVFTTMSDVVRSRSCFLDTEGGSQKVTLVVVVVVVVVISSLKIPQALLKGSGAPRNFAHTFMLTFPTYLPSQIFHLFSN